MKNRLKRILKSNRILYLLYYYIGSFMLRFLGLFIKTDPNLVLFLSYGGQKYDDSPRVVYEYLLEHPISSNQRFIWAFINPDDFKEVKNKVKIDSLSYYITALKAGYWITNASASRGLNFKKKSTRNIFFTHGMTGIKKMGKDIVDKENTYRLGFKQEIDMIFIEGKKEIDILTNAWERERDVFYCTGLPRNDDLVNITKDEVMKIKKKIGIPLDKKVILYAPTFREESRDSKKNNVLPIPFDFTRWENEFSKEYVLLITPHYEVAKLLDELPKNSFVYNGFKYPVLNDLLKISDILISDYSSVVFDYSILERPILCYGYDYKWYRNKRGVYEDLNKVFSHGVIETEDELISAIHNMNYERECNFTKKYIKEEYLAHYGNAAKRSVEIIWSKSHLN